MGGTLAHAFYPHTNTGLSGDIHFDDDEYFTIGSRYGKFLFSEFHLYDIKLFIRVRFVTYYHHDPYPFDGMGGTLTHVFYPHTNTGLSGDIHFDDDEYFTIGS